MRAFIELARPLHWVKNVFVLMPVPFALADGASLDPLTFALGLVGFALVTSGVYAFNDACDAELDREHPRKRLRPVASGRVSVRAALAASAVLLLAGALLTALSGVPQAVAITATYVVIQLLYSWRGKHVPLLDAFMLASGFVLRVLLGCALVAAAASSWLLLCTSGLSLFVAFGRRRADLLQGGAEAHRPSLSGYDRAFLDQAMTVAAAMTLIGYALYCLEAQVLLPGREFATLPFVVFAVLEYLRRTHVQGEGDSPVELVLSSPVMLICGFGWALAALWSVRL